MSRCRYFCDSSLETEKYAHVTFFFNGGREIPFEAEERILVPSPKVATYDLQPQMSVLQVAQQVVQSLRARKHSLVLCNLAPPDMVGHTGNYQATLQAVEATDTAIGLIYQGCQEAGYVLVITSDHGNAEKMSHQSQPHTAHTCSKVPLVVTSPHMDLSKTTILAHVAPLVLKLLDLPIPPEMQNPD